MNVDPVITYAFLGEGIFGPAFALMPGDVLVHALWFFPMLLVLFTSPFLAVGIAGWRNGSE